jgi:hypothetical protein
MTELDKKYLKVLKDSTRLLVKKTKAETDLSSRFELIEQIILNLQVLKVLMPSKIYTKEFSKLETSINSIIAEVSKPSFINEFINMVNEFIKNNKN